MEKINLKKQLFFVAGMSRGGTTFLYHNLEKHPGVYVAKRKELNYFSFQYERGENWFLDFFSELGPGQKGLDVSGLYFMNKESPMRIHAFNPDAKVILCIREPVEWINSFYEHFDKNYKIPPFEQFIHGCTYEREGQLISLSFEGGHIQKTVETYRTLFGSNLLICSFNLLKSDPLSLLRNIELFLGLEPHFTEENFTNKRINSRLEKRSLLIKRLVQRKWLVELAMRVLPRNLLIRLRGAADARAAVELPESTEKLMISERRALAEEVFATDIVYVQELFRDSLVVLGKR